MKGWNEAGLMGGIWWLLLSCVGLLILQRRLHFETQALFLLLTRRKEIALALYSLLLFPGVVVHEGSHYLTARLLGVRTGRFSLIPRTLSDGRLQLGFVETAPADPVRDALIGLAPLLAGSVFVTYAGRGQLGLLVLWESFARRSVPAVLESMIALPERSDFWLWFYLTFTVSSTMLPSASDRRAWLPLGLFLSLSVVVGLLAGAGPWLLSTVGPYVDGAIHSLVIVMGMTSALHLILLPPIWSLRQFVGHLTGQRAR